METRALSNRYGSGASKTCVDSRNNQTDEHCRGNDDADHARHNAAAALFALTFFLVASHDW